MREGGQDSEQSARAGHGVHVPPKAYLVQVIPNDQPLAHVEPSSTLCAQPTVGLPTASRGP